MAEPQPVQALTNLIVSELSNDELLALNLAAQLGSNPQHVMGYEKARALFTETRDGHPALHDVARDALARSAAERFKL